MFQRVQSCLPCKHGCTHPSAPFGGAVPGCVARATWNLAFVSRAFVTSCCGIAPLQAPDPWFCCHWMLAGGSGPMLVVEVCDTCKSGCAASPAYCRRNAWTDVLSRFPLQPSYFLLRTSLETSLRAFLVKLRRPSVAPWRAAMGNGVACGCRSGVPGALDLPPSAAALLLASC
jgi:hypothetical protein